MDNAGSSTVLFVDVLPYLHSTRTRKMARTLSRQLDSVVVRAVTLQRVGRTGIEDSRDRFSEDGVQVLQINARPAAKRSNKLAATYNLAVVYPLALARLSRVVLKTPAEIVVAGNTALIPLALVHSWRFKSKVVVNARERLNGIRTSGSIGTLVSRFEPALMRFLRRENVSLTSVAEGHAEEFRQAGVRHVLVIRNLPMREFIPDRLPPLPATDELVVVLVGSLYTGRAVEELIAAVHQARVSGLRVRLEITGRGSDEYFTRIKRLIESLDAKDYIDLLGPCRPDEVASRYARGHVGTALYEGVDRANDSLSNKLFESVASGRPVLAGSLSENVRVVEQYDLGWTAPVTVEGIASALRDILHDIDSLPHRAAHCYETALCELNWEAECGDLLRLVSKAAGSHHHGLGNSI